jgi:hypothetical protein
MFSAVNWLAFAASVVHSLAWPAGAVVIVTVLRRPISATLGRGVRRLRAGPVEVEFAEELAEVRAELSRSPELAAAEIPALAEGLPEDLARLADVSPQAAVMAAFSRIEARLVEVLDNAGAPSYSAAGGRALARLARRHELISDETLAVVEGLAVLRNLAAHGGENVSVGRARDYLALANAVLYVLRGKPGDVTK